MNWFFGSSENNNCLRMVSAVKQIRVREAAAEMQQPGAGERAAGGPGGRPTHPGLLRGPPGGHRGRPLQPPALQRPHHPHPRLQHLCAQIRTQVPV
jgi:hypothetical protein